MKTPFNKHNIPERVTRVLSLPYQPKPKRMSVTQLIDSPLIRTLLIEEWDNIQIDYADCLLRTYGIVWHKFIEKASIEDDEFAEQKFEQKIGDWTLVGRSDNYSDGIINDAKFTKASAINFDSTIKKWTEQQNCYAFLWRKAGFPVNKIIIDAQIRDWNVRDTVKYKYPPCAYKEVVLDLWDFDKQEQYIFNRLKIHEEQSHNECSMEDKWQQPTRYAIKKKGNKKAVCASIPNSGGKSPILTKFQAEEIIESKGLTNDYENGIISIEKREGEKIRCEFWCDLKNVCPFEGKKG